MALRGSLSVALLVLLLAQLGAAPTASAADAASREVTLYLRDGGGLDSEVPTGPAETTALGLVGDGSATFRSAPLADPVLLDGPGTLRLHLDATASVQGRVHADVTVGGDPVAEAPSEPLLVGVERRAVDLTIPEVAAQAEAGDRIGLEVTLKPLVELGAPDLTNVVVTLAYDGAEAPSRLHVEGAETVSVGPEGNVGPVDGDGEGNGEGSGDGPGDGDGGGPGDGPGDGDGDGPGDGGGDAGDGAGEELDFLDASGDADSRLAVLGALGSSTFLVAGGALLRNNV